MKKFIKSMELRRSDLFALLGLFPFAILLIFGQLFMQYPNPNDVAFPLWAAIIIFLMMIGFWGYYLYEEVWKKRGEFNKLNTIVVATLCSLVLINIIAILVQPSMHVENVIVRYSIDNPDVVGTVIPLTLNVSIVHKVFFVFELIAAAMCIYIGLFVFPRRFKSLNFIKYLGYALFIFLGVLIIYGYIAEHNNYISFIKFVFGIERPEGANIYMYSVKSFILHRNAYGMMMMVGIIFAFICHVFDKKWYYYLIAAFLYVNMIFSLCKTGLLISAIIIFVYVIYRLIITYKDHKIRNKTALISIISVIVIGGGIFAISYFSKGKFLGSLYNIIKSITGGGQTLDTRSYIWDNCYQLMRSGWWLIGRGFGTFNTMLMPMNTATSDGNDPVFPSHSSYIGLPAEGGILFLIAYLALLIYSGYVIYKSFKKAPEITLAVSLGVFSFVMYSFIETIHYFVYVFLFPIMVIYHTKVRNNQNEAKELVKEKSA